MLKVFDFIGMVCFILPSSLTPRATNPAHGASPF